MPDEPATILQPATPDPAKSAPAVAVTSWQAWGDFFRNGGRWLAAGLGSRPASKLPAPHAATKPSRLAPLVTAVLLMLVFASIPPPPMRLDIDVDSSLSGVLNYAHAQGLQHGSDVTFTYGPLGFLTFFYFSPHAFGLRMAADVALSFTVAAGICLVAWRMKLIWRVLLLGVCAWVGANVWPRTDWLINCGLLGWGLLCFVETGRRLTWAVLIFAGLGAFAALSKASFLVLVAASAGLIGLDLLVRGRRRLALSAVLATASLYLIGWSLAGQNLAHLGDYFRNSLAMIRGYNQALGWEGAEFVRAAGWRLAWVLPALVWLRTLTAFTGAEPRQRWRRCWLTLWLTGFTFASWKHGWVRVDAFHVGMFLGAVAVLALALDVLPSRRKFSAYLARGLGVVTCLLAVAAYEALYLPSLSQSLMQPARLFWEHVRCLGHPGDYESRMRAAMEAHRAEAQLPRLREIVGAATVDVFGQHAGYALFNGLNYHPRPVFQSYAACNADLMKLNEDFYRSPGAPEYVLFQLVAMDGKLPVLEDAWLLRHLLINYTPVASEGRFTLLRAKSAEAPSLRLLHAGAVEVGQQIDLRPFGDQDLWLEIQLKPTFAGRVRQLFSRPAIVKLATWREAGGNWTSRHRAPPSMLAAGFIASPRLLQDPEILNLHAGTNLVRPAAYSLELPAGTERFWQPSVPYRIYQIENRLGRDISPAFLASLKATGESPQPTRPDSRPKPEPIR